MASATARTCRLEIILTTAARTRLGLARKRAAYARLYHRLEAVFLAGEGPSATQVAAIPGASMRSLRSWGATWRRSG